MHQSKPPFWAWVGPRNPRIVFIGEAFGRDEEAQSQPFVGASGKEFWRMLGEAMPQITPQEHQRVAELHRFGNSWINSRSDWLHAAGIAFTNVFNFRPPDNSIPSLCAPRSSLPPSYDWPQIAGPGKYLKEEFLPEVSRLYIELEVAKPTLIVLLGSTACWAVLRTTGIGSIRGTVRSTPWGKALPTYHPASVLYQWSQRPIVVADLMKAQREADFPEIRRPNRRVKVNPTLKEWRNWIEDCLASPPDLLANDTETSLGMIDTISFARSRVDAIACQIGPHRVRRGQGYVTIWPQRDGKQVTSYWTKSEELEFWTLTKTLLESPIPKLGQNYIYDLQYLLRMGIRPRNIQEDSMLLHHSLFPELPKSLGFLGSIYTDEPAWKLMRRGLADSTKRDE